MNQLLTKSLTVLTVVLISLSSCDNNTTTKQPEQDKFVGAWSSVTDGGEGRPNSIYVEKEGEIYNCYFIASNGNFKNYKGIIENDVIKIGRDYSIKFLKDNNELYLVENSMQYRKMKSVEETIKEMQKDIKEVDGGNLIYFLYIPFIDEEAKILNTTPNYTITRNMDFWKAKEMLFDRSVKDCISSDKIQLTSYYDIQKNEPSPSGNYLNPWEYSITCKHSSGRDLTMIFSIRDNGYLLTKIQFFS